MKKKLGILVFLLMMLVVSTGLATELEWKTIYRTTEETAPEVKAGTMVTGIYLPPEEKLTTVVYFYRIQAPAEHSWIHFEFYVENSKTDQIRLYNPAEMLISSHSLPDKKWYHYNYLAEPGETYYIRLSSEFVSMLDYGRTYRFRVSFKPDPEPDTKEEAMPVAFGKNVRGKLQAGMDKDFFCFTTGDDPVVVFYCKNINQEGGKYPTGELQKMCFELTDYLTARMDYAFMHAGESDQSLLTDLYPNTTYYISVFSTYPVSFFQKSLPTWQFRVDRPVTITYKGNGGSGEMEKSYGIPGKEITLPACTFTPPARKVFDTWSLGNPGDRVTIKKDTVCKAIWKKDPYAWPEKNDFTVDGMKYRIISSTQVRFMGLKKESSRTSLTIPDKVEYPDTVFTFWVSEISANAMKNDQKLTTLTIGDCVNIIGKNAFAGCKKLKTVKKGAAVTSLENGAFKGCQALQTFPVLTNLYTIGDSAFQNCLKLTKFSLPELVYSVGKLAFDGCKNLKTIVVDTTYLAYTGGNVGAGAFRNIYPKAVFKCPSSVREVYRTLFVTKGAPSTCRFK